MFTGGVLHNFFFYVTVDLARRHTKNNSLSEEAFWNFARGVLKGESL